MNMAAAIQHTGIGVLRLMHFGYRQDHSLVSSKSTVAFFELKEMP